MESGKKKQQEQGPENIDWEALEAEDKAAEAIKDEVPNKEAIAKEKEQLPEEDKFNPYPDDFLADWSLLRKSLDDEESDSEE